MDDIESIRTTFTAGSSEAVDAILEKEANRSTLKRVLDLISNGPTLESALSESALKTLVEYVDTSDKVIHSIDIKLHQRRAQRSLRERFGYRGSSSNDEFDLLISLAKEDPRAAVSDLIASLYEDSTSLVTALSALIARFANDTKASATIRDFTKSLSSSETLDQAIHAYTHTSLSTGYDVYRLRLLEAISTFILTWASVQSITVTTLTRLVSTLSRITPFNKEHLEIARSAYTSSSLAICASLTKLNITSMPLKDLEILTTTFLDLLDTLPTSAPSLALPVALWTALRESDSNAVLPFLARGLQWLVSAELFTAEFGAIASGVLWKAVGLLGTYWDFGSIPGILGTLPVVVHACAAGDSNFQVLFWAEENVFSGVLVPYLKCFPNNFTSCLEILASVSSASRATWFVDYARIQTLVVRADLLGNLISVDQRTTRDVYTGEVLLRALGLPLAPSAALGVVHAGSDVAVSGQFAVFRVDLEISSIASFLLNVVTASLRERLRAPSEAAVDLAKAALGFFEKFPGFSPADEECFFCALCTVDTLIPAATRLFEKHGNFSRLIESAVTLVSLDMSQHPEVISSMTRAVEASSLTWPSFPRAAPALLGKIQGSKGLKTISCRLRLASVLVRKAAIDVEELQADYARNVAVAGREEISRSLRESGAVDFSLRVIIRAASADGSLSNEFLRKFEVNERKAAKQVQIAALEFLAEVIRAEGLKTVLGSIPPHVIFSSVAAFTLDKFPGAAACLCEILKAGEFALPADHAEIFREILDSPVPHPPLLVAYFSRSDASADLAKRLPAMHEMDAALDAFLKNHRDGSSLVGVGDVKVRATEGFMSLLVTCINLGDAAVVDLAVKLMQNLEPGNFFSSREEAKLAEQIPVTSANTETLACKINLEISSSVAARAAGDRRGRESAVLLTLVKLLKQKNRHVELPRDLEISSEISSVLKVFPAQAAFFSVLSEWSLLTERKKKFPASEISRFSGFNEKIEAVALAIHGCKNEEVLEPLCMFAVSLGSEEISIQQALLSGLQSVPCFLLVKVQSALFLLASLCQQPNLEISSTFLAELTRAALHEASPESIETFLTIFISLSEFRAPEDFRLFAASAGVAEFLSLSPAIRNAAAQEAFYESPSLGRLWLSAVRLATSLSPCAECLVFADVYGKRLQLALIAGSGRLASAEEAASAARFLSSQGITFEFAGLLSGLGCDENGEFPSTYPETLIERVAARCEDSLRDDVTIEARTPSVFQQVCGWLIADAAESFLIQSSSPDSFEVDLEICRRLKNLLVKYKAEPKRTLITFEISGKTHVPLSTLLSLKFPGPPQTPGKTVCTDAELVLNSNQVPLSCPEAVEEDDWFGRMSRLLGLAALRSLSSAQSEAQLRSLADLLAVVKSDACVDGETAVVLAALIDRVSLLSRMTEPVEYYPALEGRQWEYESNGENNFAALGL